MAKVRDLDTGEVKVVKDVPNIVMKNEKSNRRVLDDDESMVITNQNIDIKKTMFIKVPKKIESVMAGLSKEFPSVEFSIFTNTRYNVNKKCFIMDETFFIPEQEVTAAHIDYKEDCMNYNTVIHKHPNNCMNFSSTDDTYINSNFEFSLLWVNNKFEKAISNVKTTYGFILQQPITISLESVDSILPEEAKVKIKQKRFEIKSGYGYIGNPNRAYIEDMIGRSDFGRTYTPHTYGHIPHDYRKAFEKRREIEAAKEKGVDEDILSIYDHCGLDESIESLIGVDDKDDNKNVNESFPRYGYSFGEDGYY